MFLLHVLPWKKTILSYSILLDKCIQSWRYSHIYNLYETFYDKAEKQTAWNFPSSDQSAYFSRSPHLPFPPEEQKLGRLLHSLFDIDSNDPIMSQVCTCHASSAGMACAKFWHGCIIIFHIRATHIYTRFKLWAHESFVKLVPEISPPLVSVSISLDLLIHHSHQRDRKWAEAYLTKLKATHMISQIQETLLIVIHNNYFSITACTIDSLIAIRLQ